MRQLSIRNSITPRRDESVDYYLTEIRKYPLLTAAEEVFYFEMMELFKNDSDRSNYKKYEDIIIKSNLRFVVSVAKQYLNQGLSLPDLINEGNLGLVRSVSRFEVSRGFKFISYAVWWIRQSILLGLSENSRIVRLPMNKNNFNGRLIKAEDKLEQKLNYRPTIKMIASEMETSEEKVSLAVSLIKKSVSLSDPISSSGDNDDLLREDLLSSDEKFVVPDYLLETEDMKKIVHLGLKYLKPKQRAAITAFYGIDCDPENKSQIARRLGLTPEAVRVTIATGLKKLQKHKKDFERCLY